MKETYLLNYDDYNPKDYVVLPIKEYNKLKEKEDILNRLHYFGVKLWVGYKHSLTEKVDDKYLKFCENA